MSLRRRKKIYDIVTLVFCFTTVSALFALLNVM